MPRDTTGHIVALGGGGFLMEPRNPLLDDHTLALTRNREPRFCFLPAASGDSERFISRFLRAFPAERAAASVLPLFKRVHVDLESFIFSHDVMYVGGGSTANALFVWRLHGVDRVLRKFHRQGGVLTGVLAGMNCWFEGCCTDSFGPLAPLDDGLGIIKGCACPHYDGEEDRRPTLHQFVAHGRLGMTHAADDGAAFHFIGGKLHRCVASRPGASCYIVRRSSNSACEIRLDTSYLGDAPRSKIRTRRT